MTGHSTLAIAFVCLALSLSVGCVEDEGTRPQPQTTSANKLAADPAVVEDGHAIAEAHCARCHAVGTEGLSPNRHAPVFRTVLGRYHRDVLARELVDGMRVAHAPMPAFQFDPQGTDALIAYLQSIQVSSPGRLFVEEKCARCHALGRADTSPYPGAQPFRNLGARWTRDQLAEALRTGIIAEHDSSGVRFQMKLSDRDIADFLDYLDSIATRDQPAPR